MLPIEREQILVVGATGFVGRALVQALSDAGQHVRAAARRPPAHPPSGARWLAVDLERPETLPAAVEGIDCAYYLVHSLAGHRRTFRELDRRCAHHFADAAGAAGCGRIIYLGGVAPRGTPSEHLASRLEVGEILRAGRVPALELRASMIVGNGSASWQIVRDLAARLPVMLLPRWLESKSRPIALPDVIAALLDARDVTLPSSAWYDIPGPDTLRAREMLAIVAELDGRRVPALRVPVLTPALSAMWLKLVSGADYSVARELVLGLTEDLLPQRSFWEVTGNEPRWSFRAAAAHALATEPPPSRPARLVESWVHRLGPHAV